MSAQDRPRKNSILIDLLHALAAAMFAVFFVWADFLETSTKTNRGGEDALYHLVAPLLGPRLSGEPIVVVTISKSDLDAINDALLSQKRADNPNLLELAEDDRWTWPLDGSKHAEIADTLRILGPRAVFYDINFAQKRPGIAMFARSLGDLTGRTRTSNDCDFTGQQGPESPENPRRKIDLFLSYEVGSAPLTELCNRGADAAVTGWKGLGNGYPLFEIWSQCREGNCLEDTKATADELITRMFPTAAFATFESWCRGLPQQLATKTRCTSQIATYRNRASARLAEWRSESLVLFDKLHKLAPTSYEAAKLRETLLNPVYPDPVQSIQWGLGVSPLQRQVTRLDPSICSVTPEDFVDQVTLTLQRFWVSIKAIVFRELDGQTYFRCPYSLTVPLSVIYNDTDGRFKKLFENKIVMVGTAEFTGLGDYINTPVHGQIAGVYTHAQALDNLIRAANDGPDIVSRPQDNDLFSWRMAFYFVIMTAFMYLSFRIGRMALRGAISFDRLIQSDSPLRMVSALRRSVIGLGRVVLVGSLVLAIPAVAAFFFFRISHTAPIDWLAVVIAMAVVLLGIVWRTLGQILAELGVAFPPTSKFARRFLEQLRD